MMFNSTMYHLHLIIYGFLVILFSRLPIKASSVLTFYGLTKFIANSVQTVSLSYNRATPKIILLCLH